MLSRRATEHVHGVPEVVHVGDLLHAQPAELTGAHGAVHAVAAAVVGLHDVSAAARARLDLLRIYSGRRGEWGWGGVGWGGTRVFLHHGSKLFRPPPPRARSFWLKWYVCTGVFILCIVVTSFINDCLLLSVSGCNLNVFSM